MKKIVNVRFIVVLAFAIGAGAGFSYLSAYYSFPYWWLIGLVPLTAALLILFIVKRSSKYIILTLLSAMLFLCGAGGVYFRLAAYCDVSVEDGGYYEVSGTVYEKGINSYGEYVKLKNVSFDGVGADGCAYVYLTENYGQYCDVGYTVTFTSSVTCYTPFAYGNVSSTRLIEDVRYRCYASSVQSEYGFSLFGSVNSAVRELIFDNADEDVAAVAYAMLTGNTGYVDDSSMESFRYGGVAHVFAVSGLHIGLVYAAVSAVLKKMRLNKFVSAAISIVLIFLYSGVCGFTLSSIRAAIMCTVNSALRLCGGKYDGLSSVAAAFTVIMLVNPLNLLSVGFQLSVAAVAGIALFSGSIGRLLKKIRLPGKIASPVSVSLSAQISTFPILLSSFGYVSWASTVMNIIFVPLLSAVFTLLLACTVLGLLIPPIAEFILLIPTVPLGGIMSLIVSSRAEEALISGFTFGGFLPLYYLAVFILSDKVNFRLRVRSVVSVLLALVLTACIVLKNYTPRGAVKIIVSAYYNESYCVLLQTSEGNVLVVSETPSSYDISSLLGEYAAGDLAAVIILGGEESVYAYTLLGFECSDVYVWYQNINFQPYNGVTVHYEEQFTVAGISFSYCGSYDMVAECGGIAVGISVGGTVEIESCDLLISAQSVHDCESGTAVYFEQVNFEYNAYDCGDLQFYAKDGRLFAYGNLSVKGSGI